jgi:hypothetical protein
MSTANQSAQWTSTAGPRQLKAVNDAFSKLAWHGKTYVSLTDHGRTQLTNIFGAERQSTIDARAEIGEQFGYEVTRENHKAIIDAILLAIDADPLPVVDTRTTPEQREELAIQRAKDKEDREEKARLHKVDYDRHLSELRARYPWAKSGEGMTMHARCAANIREELKRTFPGIVFKVTSESFSGGNSIDVRWKLGPTRKEVEAITDKYKAGSFNGMEDIYNYDKSACSDAVSAVLGSIKYLSCERDISECTEMVGRKLCELQRIEFKGIYTEGLYGAGDTRNLHSYIYELFARHSLPPGAVVTGVEAITWNPDEARVDPNYNDTYHPFRLLFTAPEASKQAEQGATSVEGAGYRIEKHYHTKKESDFWIVVLAEKVTTDRFETLRRSCKAADGWYSRQWGKTPGGFAFNSEQAASEWASANV